MDESLRQPRWAAKGGGARHLDAVFRYADYEEVSNAHACLDGPRCRLRVHLALQAPP